MKRHEAVMDTSVLIAALRSRRGASFELFRTRRGGWGRLYCDAQLARLCGSGEVRSASRHSVANADEVARDRMKTIEAQIPEPVLKQAQQLAERERIPLEQLISLAVTQSVGVWSSESYVALRAKRASRDKFLDALKEVPDVEPAADDRLPKGYRSS